MNINELAWNERVQGADREAFLQKVIDESKKRNINPNWVMDIINNETAHTFSASIPNDIGCIGLIQFCGENIAKYVYTTSATDRVRQLDGVFAYWDFWNKVYPSTYDSVETLYMSTFFPAFVPFMNNSDNTVIEGYGYSAYTIAKANPGFDLNKDGKITVGEFKQFCRLNFSPKSYTNSGLFGIKWEYIIAAGAVIAIILIYKFRKELTVRLKKVFR